MRRQTDAIQAAVTYSAISKPMQPKTITKIPNSHHPTPYIIENDKGYIRSDHRVIAHQSKIHPLIIPPDTPQPRRMGKHLHAAYPRVQKITQPTPALLPRVHTARHHYNLRTKQQLAYSCPQTEKLSLAENFITAMKANSLVHPVTGVSQEYRNLIT